MRSTAPRSGHDAAVQARRSLLQRQAELVVDHLPWLADPDALPADILDAAAGYGGVADQCFQIAVWMVTEIVAAAYGVRDLLPWDEAMTSCGVPRVLQHRVRSAVLEPTTRYGPGISAIAEIVAATPAVAARSGLLRGDWEQVARASQRLGTRLSVDGTDVQVLIRTYLQGAPYARSALPRVLDSRCLVLDGDRGVTSVTPIDALVVAARKAVARHLDPSGRVCIALQTAGPSGGAAYTGEPTLFGAVWKAYVTAAARYVFPTVEPERISMDEVLRDPFYAEVLDRLARRRRAELAGA